MSFPSAAVLAHLTSVPGPGPIGDLHVGGREFVELCRRSGLDGWQLLPVGPAGAGNSPYSALSAFAGNPLLLSPEPLLEAGLLTAAEVAAAPPARDQVEFTAVAGWKRTWLEAAWRRFRHSPPQHLRRRHDAFAAAASTWLEEWCLFAALRETHGRKAWFDWPPPLRRREAGALREARAALGDGIDFHRFVQFLFDEQWTRLVATARRAGVSLIGDLAFYPAHDSAEVWSRPELFSMDPDGRVLESAGVPPDYYSEDGQLWGTPTYRWSRMRDDGFRWWRRRLEAQLARFDLVRLDHFRGYAAVWTVEGTPENARDGRWRTGPGAEPFDTVDVGRLIAEDLGVIDEPVRELRRRLDLPGMAVFQFLQDDLDPSGPPLPDLAPDTVLYTATHDNDTTRGWLATLPPESRHALLARLHCAEPEAVRRIVEVCVRSGVRTTVLPLQDWLDLPAAARMNRPGTPDGNWGWRLTDVPDEAHVTWLKGVLGAAGRGRRPQEPGPSSHA